MSKQVMDYGDTRVLAVFGEVGADVQLYANTLPNPIPKVMREATLVENDQVEAACTPGSCGPEQRRRSSPLSTACAVRLVTVDVRFTAE